MVHSSIRRHLPLLAAVAALFVWLFSRFFLHPLYIAESDLYENGLPIFLSPIWKWSSYEFAGLPVLADPQNFDFYPPYVILGHLLRSWTAVVMSAPLLATLFTYAYVFHLTRSRTAAVFSALAYGLSEETLERLRHLNHVHAIAWLPLILLSLERVRETRSRRWIAIGALAVGCCILSGHPQPALYVMYCVGLYAVIGFFGDRDSGFGIRDSLFGVRRAALLRTLGATAAMFAVGILLASVKAFPLIEARTLVVRSAGLTFLRFVGPSLTGPQLLTFVFPTILHAPVTELPTYVGLATLLLALVGITRAGANWRVAFWLAMSILGVGMALGTATPLVDAAYYVPLYPWFRNLARHMFLFAFGASVLAGFGIAAMQRGEASVRSIRIASALLAVVMIEGAVLMHAYPALFPLEGPHSEGGPGPLSILSVGVWIQFAILLAAIALLNWGRRSFKEDTRHVVPIAVILLLVVDLLNALPYDIKADGIEYYAITATQAEASVHARAIGRAMEPTRSRALAVGGTQVDDVLPATFARVWRIPIAGGYGAMIMDRLSRLAEMGTNGEVRPGVLADGDATLDLLAVKYVIANANERDDPERAKWLRGSTRWREAMHFTTARDTDRGTDEEVAGETDVTVFENTRALPRAWLTSDVVPMREDDAIRAIKSSRIGGDAPFDPRTTALVDPSATPPSVHFSPGASNVLVDRIGDGDIALRVATGGGGFLVLSENAYPGWRARIDSVETAIYRTDVTLQGIVVPPGTHRVEFTMESRALRTGMIVSAVAALACVGLLIL